MEKNEPNKESAGDGREGLFPKFKSTLPISAPGKGSAVPPNELDLDLDDIQSRLPYGSEDIADK